MRSLSLRTRVAICSTRASAAPVACFTCDAPLLVLRFERDCVPLERPPLERAPLERAVLERVPDERVPLERPLLRELDGRLEPDDPPEEPPEPVLPDGELDLEPPLLACGTSPPLRG